MIVLTKNIDRGVDVAVFQASKPPILNCFCFGCKNRLIFLLYLLSNKILRNLKILNIFQELANLSQWVLSWQVPLLLRQIQETLKRIDKQLSV